MNKKITGLCVTLCMVACLLSGCGGGSGTTAKTDDKSAETKAVEQKPDEQSKKAEKFTIATVVKITGIPWYDRMEVGLEKFRQDTGVDAYITGHNTADPAEQARVIEDLIAQGVDALVVIPNSTEALEPVLAKAREAGIIVIAHEATDITNADYDLEPFSNKDYGEHFMKKLGELTGGKGQYTTFLGALTAASHNEWVDASVAVQKSKFPDMELVSNKNETKEDSEIAYEKTKELLKTYPELIGFQGSAMADIPGVARAIEETGKKDSTYVIGTCLTSTASQFLETGAIDMISFWDPADAGYALNELALKLLKGEDVSKGVSLTPDGYQNLTLNGKVFNGSAWIDVTAENMGEYDF